MRCRLVMADCVCGVLLSSTQRLMLMQGIFCNLHTGQERQVIEGARHAACTIEMINTTKHWDCAVLDEIQVCKLA